MTLQNLVAELDEKRKKWSDGASGSKERRIAWEDYAFSIMEGYDQLRAAALAGSKLAEAVGKMDGGRDSDEEKNFSVFMDAGWKYQRDAALTTYHAAINPGTGE